MAAPARKFELLQAVGMQRALAVSALLLGCSCVGAAVSVTTAKEGHRHVEVTAGNAMHIPRNHQGVNGTSYVRRESSDGVLELGGGRHAQQTGAGLTVKDALRQ